MIWCIALINPLQQELHVSTRLWIITLWPFLHQGSPSTFCRVSMRRLQGRGRSSRAPCASGGRSGRGGVRSEGSSGDPPRRSAPSYSPEGTEETELRNILWQLTEEQRIIGLISALYWLHFQPLTDWKAIITSQVCRNIQDRFDLHSQKIFKLLKIVHMEDREKRHNP